MAKIHTLGDTAGSDRVATLTTLAFRASLRPRAADRHRPQCVVARRFLNRPATPRTNAPAVRGRFNLVERKAVRGEPAHRKR